jgi:site-specific DNA-methyltransferase (adenine-specific)
VELFSRMLMGSVEPGMVVCDPFAGSGSSALASLAAGCSFVGADISDTAVTLARERCAAYATTGKDPLGR